ncbi:hypothetical protein CORC01_14046, partial [Colletotrichum orchidophilum]
TGRCLALVFRSLASSRPAEPASLPSSPTHQDSPAHAVSGLAPLVILVYHCCFRRKRTHHRFSKAEPCSVRSAESREMGPGRLDFLPKALLSVFPFCVGRQLAPWLVSFPVHSTKPVSISRLFDTEKQARSKCCCLERHRGRLCALAARDPARVYDIRMTRVDHDGDESLETPRVETCLQSSLVARCGDGSCQFVYG